MQAGEWNGRGEIFFKKEELLLYYSCVVRCWFSVYLLTKGWKAELTGGPVNHNDCISSKLKVIIIFAQYNY